MTNEETKMIETLEQARKASEECRFPIYAFSNGKEIRYHMEANAKTLKKYLEQKGFWVCSIFINGMRAEA